MIEMWFDGVCEPKNPGGYAAYGIYIQRGKDVVFSEGRLVGNGNGMSNNVAEYTGFLKGLTFLYDNRFQDEEIIIRGDSKLVIEQMQGHWKMNRGFYLPMAKEAKKLVEKFKNLSFEWIPREENNICDGLGKQVLRDLGIIFKLQPEKHAKNSRKSPRN